MYSGHCSANSVPAAEFRMCQPRFLEELRRHYSLAALEYPKDTKVYLIQEIT